MAISRPRNGRGSNQYNTMGSSGAEATARHQSADLARSLVEGTDGTADTSVATLVPSETPEFPGMANPTMGPDAGQFALPTRSTSSSYLSGPSPAAQAAMSAMDDHRDALSDTVDAAEMSPTSESIAALRRDIAALTASRDVVLDERRAAGGSSASVSARLESTRTALRRATSVARSLEWEATNLVSG